MAEVATGATSNAGPASNDGNSVAEADVHDGKRSSKGVLEPKVKMVKTRRQLLEAYSSREDFHREKHYDFCSKQVLSVYTTFPRFLFPREDHRGKELRRYRTPVAPLAQASIHSDVAMWSLPAKEDSCETQMSHAVQAETSVDTLNEHVSSVSRYSDSKVSKGSVLVTGPPGPLEPLEPLGLLDPGQRSWGCSPRFPRLVGPEVGRPATATAATAATAATGEDAETEDASVEVKPYKLEALPVPIDMALLKRSPAWSFGLNRKGVSRSKATDFRKLRDAVDFDESKLLEVPRPRSSHGENFLNVAKTDAIL